MFVWVLLCVHAPMDRLDCRVGPYILHTLRSNHSLPLWQDHGSDHQPFAKPHNNTPAKAWPLISLLFPDRGQCDKKRFTSWRNDGIEKNWWLVEIICLYFLSLSQCFDACEAFYLPSECEHHFWVIQGVCNIFFFNVNTYVNAMIYTYILCTLLVTD